MRRYLVERIEGLPPKKDGAKSMWGKDVEFARLTRLRQAFLDALDGQPPLSVNIRLTLSVHVGPVNTPQTGDLDNFITGICDALQSAKPGCALLPDWKAPDCKPVHPSNAIAIVDDSQALGIDAQKIVEQGEPWYSIELVGD